MSDLRKALVFAIVFAVITGAAGMLYAAPWPDASWQRVLRWGGSFCCFGFLLGGILAFDPESDVKIRPSAIGRMAFGVVAALLLGALWRWPMEGAALACLVGALLGYFGMLWAKHVNF